MCVVCSPEPRRQTQDSWGSLDDWSSLIVELPANETDSNKVNNNHNKDDTQSSPLTHCQACKHAYMHTPPLPHTHTPFIVVLVENIFSTVIIFYVYMCPPTLVLDVALYTLGTHTIHVPSQNRILLYFSLYTNFVLQHSCELYIINQGSYTCLYFSI